MPDRTPQAGVWVSEDFTKVASDRAGDHVKVRATSAVPWASTGPRRSVPYIVGAGLITLDIVLRGVPDVAQAARKGASSNKAWRVAHWAGGTCGNVLAALSYLGWRAAPIGRLGADTAADAITTDLEQSGVETGWIEHDVGRESARIAQHITERPGCPVRHRFAFSCPVCGAAFPKYRPPRWEQYEAAIAAPSEGGMIPDVFFFDRVSPAILAMAEAFRAGGALVYFEPSAVGRLTDFRRALELCHVVKYAHDRLDAALAALGGLGRLTRRRPRVEVETLGHEGLRYRVNDGTRRGRIWRHQPAFRVTELRDAAGAGDWCSAGLLYQLGWRCGADAEVLSEDAVAHALTFGQALAALNCQHVGPRSATRAVRSGEMLAFAAAVQRDGHAPAESRAGTSESDYVPLPETECDTCLRGARAARA